MEHKFEFFSESEDQEMGETDGSNEGIEGEAGERELKVRLDKWLWAARFFKTRALARAAVENGKVFYNGQRSKPSREIEVGAILQVRLGRFEKTVIIKGLSTRRRSTEEALQLFEETEESRIARETAAQFQQTPYSPYNRPVQQPQYYDSNHPYSEQQPQRRAVRFLRRSFARPGEQPPRYGNHEQYSDLDTIDNKESETIE